MSANPFDVIVDELRALRAEVTDLRAIVSTINPPPPREVVFPTVNAFASSRGYSRRWVFARIREGLPTVGEGKGLRVDAAAADEWIRRRAAKPSIEEVARAAARKATR